MPQWGYVGHPELLDAEEFAQVLKLRRQALEDATRAHGLGEPLPIPWRHGWKAHVRILERDQDGSVRLVVVVSGPRGEIPYTRAYRLVRRHPLPYHLGQG